MGNHPAKEGYKMKELETALKQLKMAMANVDKAEEKMWANGERVNSDTAEKISIDIAEIADRIIILNRYYK